MMISIVIPFYNEADNIGRLVESLNTYLGKSGLEQAEVIFVDDGSTDRSSDLLRQASFAGYAAKLISLSRNFGSHAALRAGVAHASGDHIAFLYADLQDPPELIGRMLEEAGRGNEVVWATRLDAYMSLREKWFSRAYAFLVRRLVDARFPKNGFDVVLFSSRVARLLNGHIESNSSVFLQILSLGFRQSAIEYRKHRRISGRSKWTFGARLKLLIDSLVAFSYTPIRLVTWGGVLFFIVGLCWTVYIVTRKLIYNDLMVGWPALSSILLLGFGITNIALGILAEYLWRTLDASRKRPVYIIDEITDLYHGTQ